MKHKLQLLIGKKVLAQCEKGSNDFDNKACITFDSASHGLNVEAEIYSFFSSRESRCAEQSPCTSVVTERILEVFPKTVLPKQPNPELQHLSWFHLLCLLHLPSTWTRSYLNYGCCLLAYRRTHNQIFSDGQNHCRRAIYFFFSFEILPFLSWLIVN